jgi:hypothetical protein
MPLTPGHYDVAALIGEGGMEPTSAQGRTRTYFLSVLALVWGLGTGSPP